MKALIIEDENLIAQELQYKIAAIAPDIKIINVLPSVKTANKWFLENAEPDIIFADIQLGDGVSFEIFERFELKNPIIFTTAYDEYAIKAFKVNGVDYLLKPIDEIELGKAIDKARNIYESKSVYPTDLKHLIALIGNPNSVKSAFKEKFIVQTRKQWMPIPTADIACFLRDNLNYLITFNGEKHILDFSTLDEIEELLDPSIYYRANRQFIIHINSIKSIKPIENQKLIIILKDSINLTVDVSREKAPAFKKWFDR